MGLAVDSLPIDRLRAFCERNLIRRLALFGSALRDDFGPDSDIDLLAEFEPGARVGLLRLEALELELTDLLGRQADLCTPGFLSEHFRSRVLREARQLYGAP